MQPAPISPPPPQLRINYRMEVRSRHCMWKKLLEQMPDLPDDALLLFGDADELSRGVDLFHLKHCELKDDILPIKISRHAFAAATINRLTTPCTKPALNDGFTTMVIGAAQARREGTLAHRRQYESDFKRRNAAPAIYSGIHLVSQDKARGKQGRQRRNEGGGGAKTRTGGCARAHA